MNVRRQFCGCQWSPTGTALKRCDTHKFRDLPRDAGHIAMLADDVAFEDSEPEVVAVALDRLCEGRNEDERTKAIDYFEEVLADRSFDLMLDIIPKSD